MIETDVFEGAELAIPKTHAAQHGVVFLPRCIRTHHLSQARLLIRLHFLRLITVYVEFDVR
jgi:hypothetical protein